MKKKCSDLQNWQNNFRFTACKKHLPSHLGLVIEEIMDLSCILLAVAFWIETKLYRDSQVSAVFWYPANRTIGKTALIEHWFSSKIVIWDFWIFKVPFFAHFHYWNLNRLFLFWTDSETKLEWNNGSSLYCITSLKKLYIISF